MKKILLFLLTLFIMPVLACAFDLNHNSAEQKQLAQELKNIKEDTCDLYGLVENELLKYYGKNNIKDFYDPEHQTGWFRVYDFLSWLKNNEQELITKIIGESEYYNYYHHDKGIAFPLQKFCSLKTAETRGFLGTFLGREYLLNKYSTKNIRNDKFIIRANKKASAAILPKKIYIPPYNGVMAKGFPEEMDLAFFPAINYEKVRKVSFVNLINSAIHETMHLIGVFTTIKYQKLLPEMFTIYAQMAYALPIKSKEDFSAGVRNLYKIQQTFPEQMYKEYTEALFAYIQFKQLDKMPLEEIFSFSGKIKEVPDSFYDFFSQMRKYDYGEEVKEKEITKDATVKIIFEDKEQLIVKEGSLVKHYTKIPNNYVEEVIISTVNIEEYINKKPWILPQYRRVFKELAEEYFKLEYNALAEDYDYKKYLDIKDNPLKYILKENKNIPPTPEGYI